MTYSMGDSNFGLSYREINGKPYCIFNKYGLSYYFPLENDCYDLVVRDNKLHCSYKHDPTSVGEFEETDRFWRLDPSRENGLVNRIQANLAAELEEITSKLPTVAIQCIVCRGLFVVGAGGKCHLHELCLRQPQFCHPPFEGCESLLMTGAGIGFSLDQLKIDDGAPVLFSNSE